MDYALGLMIVWGILFLPLGLVAGRIALGRSARKQAAPMAMTTGIAIGIVLLGFLDRLGADLSSRLLTGAFVALAIGAWASMWRSRGVIRNETKPVLALVGVMVVLVAVLQAPVFNPPSGPTSYVQGSVGALEIAEIQAVAGGGPTTSLQRRAVVRYDARPAGFQQFAGFTIGLGNDDAGWTAFELTSLIAGLLLLLSAPATLVFARWRGLGRMGQFLLLAAAVLTPQAMVALGLGTHAAIACVPFAVTALVAMLLARRDRGWLAIAGVNAAALVCIGGPVALLPLAVTAIAWWILHSRVREHLAAVDVPVAGDRPLALAGAVVLLGAAGVAERVFRHPGLPWNGSGLNLSEAAISWPFLWLGGDLATTVPSGAELLVWVVGPVLLTISAGYAFLRKEGRELSILVGVLVALGMASLAGIWSADRAATVVEYVWLVSAPLLLVIGIRAGGLARAAAKEAELKRWRGFGPLLASSLVIVISVAAASTSGSRFVHAPSLTGVAVESSRTLVTSSDPWVGLGIDSDALSVPTGGTDIDRLVKRIPVRGEALPGNFDRILQDNDPFSSEPPGNYVLSGWDGRRSLVEYRRQPQAGVKNPPKVVRHDPIESLVPNTGSGGLVMPAVARECGINQSTTLANRDRCTPTHLAAKAECSRSAVAAVDRLLPKRDKPTRFGPVSACFAVPLQAGARQLRLHIRDIGMVFIPGDAIPRGDVIQATPQSDPWTLLEEGASLQFGDARIFGAYDVSVEGDFGAGVLVRGGLEGQVGGSSESRIDRGYAPWSKLLSDLTLASGVTIENATGAHASIGRLVARSSSDFARSCDVPVSASGGLRVVNSADGTPAVAVLGVVSPDRKRIELTVLNYLRKDTAPRAIMLDWIEQYDRAGTTQPCLPALAGSGAARAGVGNAGAVSPTTQPADGSPAGSAAPGTS